MLKGYPQLSSCTITCPLKILSTYSPVMKFRIAQQLVLHPCSQAAPSSKLHITEIPDSGRSDPLILTIFMQPQSHGFLSGGCDTTALFLL